MNFWLLWGEQREVSIDDADKVKTVLLEELQSPKEVEDCPTEEEIAALGIREDMLAYWLVLNSKRPFVSADEGGQEFYWNQYFWCLSQPVSMFTVSCFGIVDLDNDGTEEMVLVGFPETTQVLDYQDGKVYSYQFAFRGMASITVDGVYSSAGAADIGGFHRINFNKGEYEVETLAYMEEDFYEVEGVEVSEEEFFCIHGIFCKGRTDRAAGFYGRNVGRKQSAEGGCTGALSADFSREKGIRLRNGERRKICYRRKLYQGSEGRR